MNLQSKTPEQQYSIGFLIVGTGSSFNLENASNWGPHLKSRSSVEVIPAPRQTSGFCTAKKHLEKIRNILNPRISDLADVLDVSRQSIYKWLSESSCPEEDKLEKIKVLSNIADLFEVEGVKRAGDLLKIRSASGDSLYDLLKEDKPYEDHIKMLLLEVKAMKRNQDKIRNLESRSAPTDDWKSNISIPSYREES